MEQILPSRNPEVVDYVRKSMTTWLTLLGLQTAVGLFTTYEGINRLPTTYDPLTIKFLLWTMLGAYIAQLAWFSRRAARERGGVHWTEAQPLKRIDNDYKDTTKIFIVYCFTELAVFATLAHRV